jgi:hypothetical protein
LLSLVPASGSEWIRSGGCSIDIQHGMDFDHTVIQLTSVSEWIYVTVAI